MMSADLLKMKKFQSQPWQGKVNGSVLFNYQGVLFICQNYEKICGKPWQDVIFHYENASI